RRDQPLTADCARERQQRREHGGEGDEQLDPRGRAAVENAVVDESEYGREERCEALQQEEQDECRQWKREPDAHEGRYRSRPAGLASGPVAPSADGSGGRSGRSMTNFVPLP